jgi:hypothetical protein
MPRVLDFNVSVEMESNALPEYGSEVGVDEAGRPIVTCWIASEAGKVIAFAHFTDVIREI